MFKCFFKLVIIYGIQQQVISHTVNVEEKVHSYRHKLKKQIQKIHRSIPDEPQGFLDNYDLIVGEPAEVMIKHPHLRSGQRHKHRVRKHRASMSHKIEPNVTVRSTTILSEATTVNFSETISTNFPERATTTTDNLETSAITSYVSNDSFETNVKMLEAKVETAIANLTDYLKQSKMRNVLTTTYSPRRVNQPVSPKIPFFRRFNFMHDSERNKPQKWVHCLDLITPRLLGMKDESKLQVVTHTHGDVKRLAHLLYTDVRKFNAQDMVSLLSQISKMRIRMYQWDQNAITLIFNVIIKGSVHDFKTLKSGIKELFRKWHLDVSDMRVFLSQTRLFRPPCIDITGFFGLTKKTLVTMPYKLDKPTKKKRDPNVSCKSKENVEPYDNRNP